MLTRKLQGSSTGWPVSSPNTLTLLHTRLTPAALEGEKDAIWRKNEELAQAFREKSRRLLQTQELYDKVKRKAEMGDIQRAACDAVDSSIISVPPDTSHTYDAYSGVTQSDGRQSMDSSFGQGRRFGDMANMNSVAPRSNAHHFGDGDNWSRPGGMSRRKFTCPFPLDTN